MQENLKIIQDIIGLSIKISQTQNMPIRCEYHSASSKLSVSICTEGNPTFNDGLTRSWWVSVKNTEMLKTVLEELKALDKSDDEDDFLG